MGWAGGSGLLVDIARLEKYFYGDTAVEFYTKLIDILEDYDCDTIDEAWGVSPHLDKAIDKWREQFSWDADDE